MPKSIDHLEKIDASTAVLEAVNHMLKNINHTLKPPMSLAEMVAALMMPTTETCVRAQVEMLRDPEFFNEEYHGI